jgi:hypothetical protein
MAEGLPSGLVCGKSELWQRNALIAKNSTPEDHLSEIPSLPRPAALSWHLPDV